MASDLDRKFDETLAQVTGPGGRLVIERDEQGRAIVANFPATLPSLLRTFCALYAATEALVAGDERFTFAELDLWSERLARALAARGIGKGDRVAIAIRNSPSWIVAYMATLKAGAVATLLNGWWQAPEMAHALELTEPALVIADLPRAERIEAAGEGLAIVALEVDAYATGLIVLKAILEGEGRPPPPPRTLLSVPLFHVTGEVPVLLNSFVVGRGMVLMPKWDPGEALRLIEKEEVTYFVGVPTMSLELMTHPERDKFDLSSLTDIAAGGAPRPVSHVERLRESFPTAKPALGYGLTETNAVGCINFWSNYADKPGSTGRAQKPFVEIGIFGEDDRHLPAGERGSRQ